MASLIHNRLKGSEGKRNQKHRMRIRTVIQVPVRQLTPDKAKQNLLQTHEIIYSMKTRFVTRNLLLIFTAIATCLSTSAQTGLKGQVMNEKGTPLSYVNVSLLPAKKAVLPMATGMTDSAGKFQLASPGAGTYFLQFTAIDLPTLSPTVLW